jgi:hypothetical protein
MVEDWKNVVESAQIIFRGKRGKARIEFFN